MRYINETVELQESCILTIDAPLFTVPGDGGDVRYTTGACTVVLDLIQVKSLHGDTQGPERVASCSINISDILHYRIYCATLHTNGLTSIDVSMAIAPVGLLRDVSKSRKSKRSRSMDEKSPMLMSVSPSSPSSSSVVLSTNFDSRVSTVTELSMSVVQKNALRKQLYGVYDQMHYAIMKLNELAGECDGHVMAPDRANAGDENCSRTFENIYGLWERICIVLSQCTTSVFKYYERDNEREMNAFYTSAIRKSQVSARRMMLDVFGVLSTRDDDVAIGESFLKNRAYHDHMHNAFEYKSMPSYPSPLIITDIIDARIINVFEETVVCADNDRENVIEGNVSRQNVLEDSPPTPRDSDAMLSHAEAIDINEIVLEHSKTYMHNPNTDTRLTPRGCHLIVCIHGLYGSSADLSLWRARLMLSGLRAEVLMSEANEHSTFGDIGTSGHALASEVLSFVSKRNLNVCKLSFICHSLGGIIARAALTENILEHLLSKCHTFVSLSVPHLGTRLLTSSVVSSSLCLLRNCWSAASIKQLCLKDSNDFKYTYMYKLAQRDQLYRFNNIVLVSSPQDKYCPHYSARIQLPVENSSINKLQQYSTLAGYIWKNVLEHRCNVVQLDVVHDIPSSILGREAHILMLDSDHLCWLFANIYKKLL